MVAKLLTNDVSKTALLWACHCGTYEVVRALLDAGADVELAVGKMTPLIAH